MFSRSEVLAVGNGFYESRKRRWADESSRVFFKTSLLLSFSQSFLRCSSQSSSETPTRYQTFFHIIGNVSLAFLLCRYCHPVTSLSLGVCFPECPYISYGIFFHYSFGTGARLCPFCLNLSSNSQLFCWWHEFPTTGENNPAWPRPAQTSLCTVMSMLPDWSSLNINFIMASRPVFSFVKQDIWTKWPLR